MKATTSKKLVALVLALVMSLSLVACGGTNGTADNGDGGKTVIVDTDGTVIEVPDPDANGKGWVDLGGWGNGNDGGKDNGNSNSSDGHVPGTPRESKATTKNELNVITKSYASDGKLITLVKSISNPTKPDTKNIILDSE